jgi:hypothetical protein
MIRTEGPGGTGGTAGTVATAKLAPAARMIKTQVDLFVGGQYIDVMCFCEANILRLRRANCLKVKKTYLGTMAFEQPLELEHQYDPLCGLSEADLRVEGWQFLLEHLDGLPDEVFPSTAVRDMREWWKEVKSTRSTFDRQVQLLDEFFLLYADRVCTPGWKQTLRDEIFKVQDILYGLSQPSVANKARTSSRAAGGAAAEQRANKVQGQHRRSGADLTRSASILPGSRWRILR